MVPTESGGLYPEWKNFTLVAGTTDQISRVLIQWDGQTYHFSEAYIIPPGWGPEVGIPPLPGTNESAITFESTDEAFDITFDHNGTFKLEFSLGPSEGYYDFVVTTVDRTGFTQDFHLQQHVIPEFGTHALLLVLTTTTVLAFVIHGRKRYF
jgi:archaellin